jgi:hypothetical protein
MAGSGIAQIIKLGPASLRADSPLVELFSDLPDQHLPLHASHPLRHHPPARARAFQDHMVSLAHETS